MFALLCSFEFPLNVVFPGSTLVGLVQSLVLCEFYAAAPPLPNPASPFTKAKQWCLSPLPSNSVFMIIQVASSVGK